ncbi:hypothetical protein HK096_004810 [Nowakowskiella sp. JEL0078]|nr:hypothetical protein HK096_004810 [Nowakowskiella sp. JEL0078]
MLSISSLVESQPNTHGCSASSIYPLLSQASKYNTSLLNLPVSPPQELVDSAPVSKHSYCLRTENFSLQSRLKDCDITQYNNQIRLPPLNSILKSPYEREIQKIPTEQRTNFPVYNHSNPELTYSKESRQVSPEGTAYKFRFSPLSDANSDWLPLPPSFEKSNSINSMLNHASNMQQHPKYLPSPPTYHVLVEDWHEERRINYNELHYMNQTPDNSPPVYSPSHITDINDNATGYMCRHCLENPDDEAAAANNKKIFRTINSLRLHIKLHHEKGRTFACAVQGCDKAFFRKQDLERHAATHLPDGFKPFVCTDCGTRFTRNDALRRHVKAKRCRRI